MAAGWKNRLERCSYRVDFRRLLRALFDSGQPLPGQGYGCFETDILYYAARRLDLYELCALREQT